MFPLSRGLRHLCKDRVGVDRYFLCNTNVVNVTMHPSFSRIKTECINKHQADTSITFTVFEIARFAIMDAIIYASDVFNLSSKLCR